MIPFGVVATLAHLGAGEDQSWQQGQSSSSQEANLAIVALSMEQDPAEDLPSQMALAGLCKIQVYLALQEHKREKT